MKTIAPAPIWKPTLADRIWVMKEKARLAAARTLMPQLAAPGSISGLDQRTLSRWADVSHWTGVIPLEVMKHFDGLFPKCCDGEVMVTGGSEYRLKDFVDPTFHDQVQVAYDAKAACIPFIYWQPVVRYNLDYAINHTFEVFKYATEGLKPGVSFQGICIDVEEPGDTSTNAMNKVLGLWKLLDKDPDLAGEHLPIYTSMHILNDFYPALRENISQNENYDLWMAQWYSGSTLTGSWEAIDAYLNSIVMRVGTPGFATWRWVQAMGAVTPPGMKSPLGVSYFKGDTARCYDYIGFKAGTTPPPEPPPLPPDVGVRLAALESSDVAQDQRLHELEQPHHHETGEPIK